MSETGATKRQARLEELRAASEEVMRLRRELSSAESRGDALLQELAAAAPALRDAVLPARGPIVVQTRIDAFLERIRPLTGEFSRAQAGRFSGVPDRTTGECLAQAIRKGILRRTQPGRFTFSSQERAD